MMIVSAVMYSCPPAVPATSIAILSLNPNPISTSALSASPRDMTFRALTRSAMKSANKAGPTVNNTVQGQKQPQLGLGYAECSLDARHGGIEILADKIIERITDHRHDDCAGLPVLETSSFVRESLCLESAGSSIMSIYRTHEAHTTHKDFCHLKYEKSSLPKKAASVSTSRV